MLASGQRSRVFPGTDACTGLARRVPRFRPVRVDEGCGDERARRAQSVSFGPSPNGREGFRGRTRHLRVPLTAGRRHLAHELAPSSSDLVFESSIRGKVLAP
jgi:hypothetical protein